MKRSFMIWAVLMAALGAQFGLGLLPLGSAQVAVALGLSAAMAAIVAFACMDLARAPRLAAIFAVGGILWLMVLFTLGGAEYATRLITPVAPPGPARSAAP